MARGPKHHLKRIAAPSHWNLDKLGGVYAPRPVQGPHALRECVPMVLLLRNRLRYALTYHEAMMIAKRRNIKVDGKVRTDMRFPLGFMDVVSIEKSKEHLRIILDVHGRYKPHPISAEEATYKLCRVRKVWLGVNGVPHLVTHDGRTIRYFHPDIKPNDTVRFDLKEGKVLDFVKFDIGKTAILTSGKNIGRIGVITALERHPGDHDIVHLKDARGHSFCSRIENAFVIGDGKKLWVTLPKGAGIKKSNIEHRNELIEKSQRE